MKVLITGICGFVGSSLARHLLNTNDKIDITGVDDLSYGYIQRIEDFRLRIKFYESNVSKIESFLCNEQFDLVVHCAAIAPLPDCQQNSYSALLNNVAVCGAVADYCTKSGSKNLIFFSSGAVYEGVKVFPTPEDINISPKLTYPITKRLAEQFFEGFSSSFGLNVICLRLFNLYGPAQDYFRKQPPLIGYLLRSLINGNEAVLYSTGEQRRDYIHINDLTRLIIKISEKLEKNNHSGHFDIVNVGSGNTYSVNDIIDIIENISQSQLKIKRLDPTDYWNKYESLFDRILSLDRALIESEVLKFTCADTAHLSNEYDFSASMTIEDGLKDCFKYAKKLLKNI